MRLSESVDQKFWKNLRSKWPEPLEPTWKLTFKTPKYQEKVYWHHFDIKHCISWDFSFRTWFLKVMEFVVLFWSQLTPSHLGEIQNKPRKKKFKNIGPYFWSVSYFKKWFNFNKSCESVVNLILKMNSIWAFLMELMWAHLLEEQLSNYKIVVSSYFDQATGKA